MTFCEIILVGNVGREPELGFTSTGQAVCDFSLATNKRRKQGDEWITITTWFKVVVWGNQAETVNQYVQKGKQVLVVADEIEAEPYTKEGEAKATLKVTARTVRFLGSNERSEDTPF